MSKQLSLFGEDAVERPAPSPGHVATTRREPMRPGARKGPRSLPRSRRPTSAITGTAITGTAATPSPRSPRARNAPPGDGGALPKNLAGSVSNAKEITEREKRDAALDVLEEVRSDLIEIGKRTALDMARFGPVSAPMVLTRMRADGHGARMAQVDSRWAGCLFRRGWRRVGYEPLGSHCRPAAMWERL